MRQDPGPPSDGAPRPPKGLRDQLGTTREAILRMARAHVALGRAEADAIKGEVARAAALAGVAIALLILLAFLLPIGTILFAGEWIFGSIGWGLLHGTELILAVVILLALIVVRVRGLAVDLLVAILIGIVIAVLLGPSLPNQAWRQIGDAANLGDPAWRPLLTGVLVVAAAGAILGFLAGVAVGSVAAVIAGTIVGLLLGAPVGAFSAISFGWRAGVAVGVAVGLASWPVLMGARVARQGIDGEALKARFWPQATIDTTKETIEWAKARIPFGPRS